MPGSHDETHFEAELVGALLETGGYAPGSPADYDPEHALFPRELLAFVQATQPAAWAYLQNLNGAKTGEVLLDCLHKELHTKGMLAVLRGGFKCYGRTLRAAWFAPGTGMNPDAWARYAQNRLTVVRQVQTRSGAIPDVVLAVNGLPVATLELKNPFTGQTVADAVRQYCGRDPRELLYAFKQRCLVHFAVDTEQVKMATRLEGPNTLFLPFNLGCDEAAGNPPAADDVRTRYLRDVLSRDSLLDILARFLHLQVEEKQIETGGGVQQVVTETMIFPRYHQLDAVRKLVRHARAHGSGHNYLIQHSAGSGKSNSIAWLAHQLSNLHDAADNKVFHSVVVITDRRVLDRQLQETIFQFDHKAGVVQKIDEDTQQLVKALAGGAPVIISTIQKFPFIVQALGTLARRGESVAIDTAGKRFAVIVDEAHSSQSGETALELRKILNAAGIEAAVESAIAEQLLDGEEDDLSDAAKEALLREQLKRTRQPNLSYFAFTATPKHKTLVVFDEPGENGRSPFHRYSMRQAIEEGFIMDVLAHYTEYRRYYRLIEEAQEDPEVPRRKAARALARFVDLHPHNIRQKVEVIVEHFRTHTRHRVGGRAKAMVVTSSREHAVRYKLAVDAYLAEKVAEQGADKDYAGIKALVAFSGEVRLADLPGEKWTEVQMNGGIKESELPDKFKTAEYQVLIVAEKYQTGFDQPLLHTMYVDKRLAGVHAVQTLSRLNRVARGKEETFVLDFVNTADEIFAAFKPYYERTEVGEQADPQQLNDLAHQLGGWRIYYPAEVDAWCDVWYRSRMTPTAGDHKKLNAVLDVVVDRYRARPAEEQELFKSQLQSFRALYLFLSQVIPYQDSDLEKLYSFGRFLLTKLPPAQSAAAVRVDGDVELQYYRLQKISEGSIKLLNDEPAGYLDGPTDVGTGRPDEQVQLSALVDALNERFGTEFTLADQLFFEQVRVTAAASERLRQAAAANTLENFAPVFHKELEALLIERMDGNEEIFQRLMNDDEFRALAAQELMRAVYEQIRRSGQ